MGMNTLVKKSDLLGVDVKCTKDALIVLLSDGRSITVPLAWFPRLHDATARQKADWEWIGGGIGVHWKAVDEDISIASLLQPENLVRPKNTPPFACQPERRVHAKRPGSHKISYTD
jgi:hypothetical protein